MNHSFKRLLAACAPAALVLFCVSLLPQHTGSINPDAASDALYAAVGQTGPRSVVVPEPQELFIVGDVHGCFDEMVELVTQHRRATERLVFVGDLVTKGPKEDAVVRQIIKWDALAVLGNNDLKVLRAIDVVASADAGGKDADNNSTEALSKSRDVVAKSALSRASIDFLRSLPLFIRFPRHNLVVVHAGVAPGHSPEDTSDNMLMNLRSIKPDGSCTAALRGGEPWAASWSGPEFVVFGHDATRALQVYPHALGVDSGCVYGGSLTAVRWPSMERVSVPAKQRYFK